MVYGAGTTPLWSIFDSKNENGPKKVNSVKIDNKIWRSNFFQIHFMGNSNSSVSILFTFEEYHFSEELSYSVKE